MNNNFVDTFQVFLKTIKVPVTKTSATTYLETHPDEGSMLAYADALNHFKIENAAIRITQEDLVTLPTPFIAFSNIHGGTFSVIKSLNDSAIEWYDTQKGWVNDRLEDFTKTWSGVVLLAETTVDSGEKNFAKIRNTELLNALRIPLAISLFCMVLIFFIFKAPIQLLQVYILLGLKAIGMLVSTLLLVKSIDNGNSLVNKLCNSGSKISCQSILDSPAAKITSWFTWSDAGFIYFFGSFFALLFTLYDYSAFRSYANIQLLFSGFAILFSSYSLYYQGIKAKMWCTLCLGIVTVFVFEAILSISTLNLEELSFSWPSLPFIFFGFMLPVIFLLIFKSNFSKAQEAQKLRKDLSKLKSNPQILSALLNSEKDMLAIPADMPIIEIGNTNAENVITMVSNPLCTPCAHMHTRIERLLEEHDNLKCQIIFLSNTAEDDQGGKFVRKLFNLPKVQQANGLHSWFSRNDKNYEFWVTEFENSYNDFVNNNILDQHLNWVNLAEVKATPSLFFNGKNVSEALKLEDIIFFAKNNNSIL